MNEKPKYSALNQLTDDAKKNLIDRINGGASVEALIVELEKMRRLPPEAVRQEVEELRKRNAETVLSMFVDYENSADANIIELSQRLKEFAKEVAEEYRDFISSRVQPEFQNYFWGLRNSMITSLFPKEGHEDTLAKLLVTTFNHLNATNAFHEVRLHKVEDNFLDRS